MSLQHHRRCKVQSVREPKDYELKCDVFACLKENLFNISVQPPLDKLLLDFAANDLPHMVTFSASTGSSVAFTAGDKSKGWWTTDACSAMTQRTDSDSNHLRPKISVGFYKHNHRLSQPFPYCSCKYQYSVQQKTASCFFTWLRKHAKILQHSTEMKRTAS